MHFRWIVLETAIFGIVALILVQAFEIEFSRLEEDNMVMFLSCKETKDDDDTYSWNINFVQGRIFDALHILIVIVSAL